MSDYRKFLVRCSDCGANTSKQYARANAGKCKACAHPETTRERENALLIDSGYQAFARERGDYDLPDCY